MKTNQEILVELATKPLVALPGDCAAAQAGIRARMEESGVADDLVCETIQSFERADRRGIVRYWKLALYAVVAVLMVAGVVQSVRMRAALGAISGIGSLGGDSSSLASERPARFSADQLLLLYGRDGVTSQADRWKPLWDSEPNNPEYFAEYVSGVYEDTKSVPDDVLLEAARIDPDNGWYVGMKASSLLEDNVQKGKQKEKEREALEAFVVTVSDEDSFNQAIALLHEMARKPKYDSYLEKITRKRLSVMGKSTDWISYIEKLVFAANETVPAFMGISKYSQALALEAERCADKGDREGYLRVIATWNSICEKYINNGCTLVEMLMGKVLITEPAANFRDAALTLGLENEAKRFGDLARWKYEDKKVRKEKRDASDQDMIIEKRASLMASLSLPMIGSMAQQPPIITTDDLQPSRLVEHAFILRMLTGAGGLILLLAAGVAGLRLACSSKRNLVLSRRFSEMLPARDWLLILLVGGVLPVLWYAFLIYLTPLSSRDWSMRMGGMFQFPLQFLFAVILVMSLTSTLVSWRCDKRLAMLCGKSKSPKLRWIMAASAFLALPVCGAFLPLFPYVHGFSALLLIVLWVAGALSLVPFLWMAFRLTKRVFGKRDHTPRTATLIRMAVPGLFVGILTLATASPLLIWEEKHWLAKDRLLEITPEAPAMSRYEWDVTQVLRAELLEVLAER